MSQSLSKLYTHVVFSTKQRFPFLSVKETREEMFAYLGGACNSLQSQSILVGGMSDHIHILCVLSKNISMADLVGEIKRTSSKWIKQKNVTYRKFAWQNGYGAFSVSPSQVDAVCEYICRQEIHHRRRSFQDEFRQILKKYDLPYDERYVWD